MHRDGGRERAEERDIYTERKQGRRCKIFLQMVLGSRLVPASLIMILLLLATEKLNK